MLHHPSDQANDLLLPVAERPTQRERRLHSFSAVAAARRIQPKVLPYFLAVHDMVPSGIGDLPLCVLLPARIRIAFLFRYLGEKAIVHLSPCDIVPHPAHHTPVLGRGVEEHAVIAVHEPEMSHGLLHWRLDPDQPPYPDNGDLHGITSWNSCLSVRFAPSATLRLLLTLTRMSCRSAASQALMRLVVVPTCPKVLEKALLTPASLRIFWTSLCATRPEPRGAGISISRTDPHLPLTAKGRL